MAFTHHFKPAHKEIKGYYEALAGYANHQVAHEGATSSAFQNLLATTAKKADWHLVPEQATRVPGKQVRPDGTLRDDFNLHRGYWEAKDSACKLNRIEISSANLPDCRISGKPISYTPVYYHGPTLRSPRFNFSSRAQRS